MFVSLTHTFVPAPVMLSICTLIPAAGCFREIYRIPEEGVLHIESVTTINGQTASTLQVSRRCLRVLIIFCRGPLCCAC